jgi:excisionase family DNA binding protein
MLPKLVSAADLEQLTRISRKSWYTWAEQGLIPVVRAGRLVRFDEAAVLAFLGLVKDDGDKSVSASA